MLLLTSILALWIFVGVVLFWLFGYTPRPGTRALVRSVDRRICLVGDEVGVTLSASAKGLPAPQMNDSVTPWDIVLVIDHSGSMGSGVGSALHEARKAAINLVRTTPAAFRFSVVQFDHEAQEICPLTDRKKGLVRAINGIGRGGATDIALGLEIAGRALEQNDRDDSTRELAVILLSDGGSDHDAALAAADALKTDPDLLLITIGIGAAELSLLRRIASTPDHCYHADQIDQLVELYTEIGRMITGLEATEVKVTETYDLAGQWGMRSWGELQPSEIKLRDGGFSWPLAALEETPIRLRYRVEAMCPGWRAVAPDPARISAKLGDDSRHEDQSNRGPRVLILPSVPGWQVLWVLLNPLYFLLFGRFHRCDEGVVRRAAPVVPPPRELKLPPTPQPQPSPEPQLSVRPTLILGIGYAGIHALAEAKRLAAERGERLDMDVLRLLAIDTADEVYFPSPQAGLVALDADQRITLDRPLEPVIAAEVTGAGRYPWLDAARLSAGGARPDLHRGTGNQRTLGRLAILENLDALEQRIGTLIDALIARSDISGIDVLVTASSGGGTGSGGVLDLCWLVRHLLEQRGFGDSATTLVLSAPDARQEQESPPEVRAMRVGNHKALLAELDRISTQRGELLAPMPGLPPVRRWVDRVFFVGPSGSDTWPAEAVLYPKTGELLFTWLASDHQSGLRAHFVDQDATNNRLTRQQGRCLLHRIDPVSQYLYPKTLGTYLVVDTLRRVLAQRWWGIETPGALGYSADANASAATASLLQTWLDARPADTDYPWVVNSLAALGDPTRLQSGLNRGAGPQISSGISPLDRGDLFEEQRKLVRAVLDNWVMQTLNEGWEAICDAQALAACIHALRELRRRLREGTDNADLLVQQSRSALVRGEAETVAELTTQAVTETESVLRVLDQWDRCVGDGRDGNGLMRLLDTRSGLLRLEVEALRGAQVDSGAGRRAARSPLLPLTWDQIEALVPRFFGDLGERLFAQIGWRLERPSGGPQANLCLHVQGAAGERRWSLDELQSGDQAIEALARAMIQLGTDLANGLAAWTIDEYGADALPESAIERPRTEQLNVGARGLFLTQGEGGHFQHTGHLESIRLEPFDRREARIIGCEEHLASNLLWPTSVTASATPALAADSPFVFPEERTAYRGYLAYCRAENLEPAVLPPSLSALCREPRALLAFALAGLAGGHLRARDDGLRRVWSVSGLDGQSGPLDLAEHVDEPLGAFQRVANAWVAIDAPELRWFTAVSDDSAAELAGRIAAHELAAAIADDPWYEDFVAVVWGLLRWY